MAWKIGLLMASLWVSIAHASIESWSDKTICRVLESHADEQVYIDEAIARGLPCAPEANASANTERNQDEFYTGFYAFLKRPKRELLKLI